MYLAVKKRVMFLSIFTFEQLLCLLLSLIYPAVYLLNKDLCDQSYAKKVIFFPEKRMQGIFVYVLEYILTLDSLDKMQNISTLMRKSSKSEDRAF